MQVCRQCMTTTAQSTGTGIGRNLGRANIAHKAWSLEMAITAMLEEDIIIGRRTWGRTLSRGPRTSIISQHPKTVGLWRVMTICGD